MSTHEDTMTTETKTTDRGIAESTEKLVQGLVGLGRLWAAHGLGIGRSALATSAETLRTTAELLGEISSKIEPQDPPPHGQTAARRAEAPGHALRADRERDAA